MMEKMTKHSQVALHLVLFAGAIMVGSAVTFIKEMETRTELEQRLSESQEVLRDLAETTDRNGSDEELSSIFQDCTRRSEYESLLVKLGSLEKKDLITVQNLHENCGLFFAQQKALMVQKLRFELNNFEETLILYKRFGGEIQPYKVSVWRDLVSLEEIRSSLLYDLSVFQEEIITGLISGSRSQSEPIQTLVMRAQEISQLIAVHDKKIDELRMQIN